MRMQFKLTLAFLLAGIIGATTVGGVANWMVMRHFQEESVLNAFQNFQQDILGFMNEHGGWHEAMQQETFHSYVIRTRHPEMSTPGLTSPPRPRPDQQLTEANDGSIQRQPGPAFKFMVLDENGFVQNPNLEEFEIYSKVPSRILKKAMPIYFNGKAEAYAYPLGEPILSQQEKQYLQALQQSLWIGLGSAAIVAVFFGLLFGRGLTTTLTKLTTAIKALHDDQSKEFHVKISSKDELGELATAFNEMNSQLSQAHRELKELSIRDGLTGLFNRRHFDEQAKVLYEQALRYEQPLSVAIGDIDFFKKINDSFSHAVGDSVLKEVSNIFLSFTRKSDVVARYGGEEFVIIFPNSTLEQATGCCEKIRLKIESHNWSAIHPNLSVTISLGLCSDKKSLSAGKMILIADNNLYLAKERGRNSIVSSLSN